MSHKRRERPEPLPSFQYSGNLALQDELHHPVINNSPAVLVCVDKGLGTSPVNQPWDAGGKRVDSFHGVLGKDCVGVSGIGQLLLNVGFCLGKVIRDYPQMVLARMVSMPDLAGTSSMDLERPSTNWTDTVLFAKNFSFVPIAGHFKSCYANHVFGRREDGTPFMKCCNHFIDIMGAVFTCIGLKSKRAKPSSAWLSYELLFH